VKQFMSSSLYGAVYQTDGLNLNDFGKGNRKHRTCRCGECPKCKHRAAKARWRARKAAQ
jgi:hypothetical protein